MKKQRSAPARPGRGVRPPSAWAVAIALAVVLATQYAYAVAIPFINDDYVFLDKTRTASFGSLFGFRALTFNWYRPWSRELHYWTLSRLFGERELPFHLASFALWIAVIVVYFLFARRLAGTRVAAVAAAAVAAMAAWAVPILWIAGVQDLWMLLFALLALHAFARARIAWSTAFVTLALLSKETAAFLPAALALYAFAIERRSMRDALARTWPAWLVLIVWAAIHPALGGRWWRPVVMVSEPGLHPPLASVVTRTALALVDLDFVPAPTYGWALCALRALPAVLALGGLALWGVSSREEGGIDATGESNASSGREQKTALASGSDASAARRPAKRAPSRSAARESTVRVALFGIGWALLAWAPLFMPSLGWHAYYALAGSLGAWLVIGLALARRRVVAVAVIASLALLRSAMSDTPSRDWGTESYQRRAAEFLRFMRDDLLKKNPAPPPRSRLFFTAVPNNVGFLTGNGPSLRVWYRDPTLLAGFYSAYTPRTSESSGRDYFFRYDSTGGWVPIAKGNEDLGAARADNPAWEYDHRGLAALFARAQEWRSSSAEFAKLAEAFPANPDYAYQAGVASEAAGDPRAAALWYRRAATTQGATDEMIELAHRFAQYLRSPP